MCNSSIDLQNFFPTNKLKITNISEDTKVIKINLKSQSNTCICPNCNTTSHKYHGTYIIKVQDLPILGKRVLLEINVIDSVLSEITKFVNDIKNSNLYYNLKSQFDDEVIKHEQYINSYNDELELLKKRKSKYIAMLIDEIITKADYDLFINQIDKQISSLENDILLKKKALDSIASSSVLDDIKKIRNEDFHLKKLTKDLLNRFIKRIDIKSDGTPIISFRLPNDLSN